MLLTVTILLIECFGILMFLFGYVAGKQFERAKSVKKKVQEPSDESFDPITPEDQMLISMLEEEAKRRG